MSLRARIVSIQVGLPEQLGTAEAAEAVDQAWISGIVKKPVSGPVAVGKLNLAGDGQADLVHHGGPDRAVLAYSADHYGLWRSELGIGELCYGAFGENLTIQGLAEQDLCIGDIFRANDVLFQVSQPRQPCWKLGRRWRRAELPKLVIKTGRSGWYLRVLREGTIESGVPIVLEARLHPQWTVTRTAELKYDKHADRASLAALAGLEELAESWREDFARRALGDQRS